MAALFNKQVNHIDHLKDNFIVVSGLPRSGTSMMMQMLEAGGMTVTTDNIRKSDDDNPRGYYELEISKKIKDDASWLENCSGKVFKMVSELLYHLPAKKMYKVIFMKRELEEILASQKVMLGRMGRKGADVSDEQMVAILGKHLRTVEDWLVKQHNIDVLYIQYNDVITHPHENASFVSRFLNGGLDVEKMVKVVDNSLYRQRMRV